MYVTAIKRMYFLTFNTLTVTVYGYKLFVLLARYVTNVAKT